jgi:predicted AAA+ superfamily ATPase
MNFLVNPQSNCRFSAIMLQRNITPFLSKAWAQFPVVVLTGARQVGKTTLARHFQPKADYVSLDVMEASEQARLTPAQFLQGRKSPLIVDEVQYAPSLFREIKVLVEQDRRPGQFLLTGSQSFALMANVSESLAGRSAILQLPALGIPELPVPSSPTSLVDDFIWRGGFPEFWKNPALDRDLWFGSYISTYLERDVRNLLNIGNLRDFNRLLRALALRAGQILSFADLARDVGISPNTAKSWVSVLETGQLIFLLEPYSRQRTKRRIKSPKVYFSDTGLLVYLMGFQNANEIPSNALYGAVWENLVVSETRKIFLSCGKRPPLWFWRTMSGHEVDLLVECAPEQFITVECKTAAQVTATACNALKTLKEEYGEGCVKKGFVACRCQSAYPLVDGNLLEAVPLAGPSGLLARIQANEK